MLKNVLEYIVFILFVSFIRIMPLFLVRRIAVLFSYIMFYILGYRKKVILSNLHNAYPDKPVKEIRNIGFESTKNFIISMFEFCWQQNMTKEKMLKVCRFKNPEVFESALKKKKGVIILTAHFGNWEYLGQSIAVRFDSPFPAIAKAMRNKYVNRSIDHLRKKFGNRPAYMDTGVKDFFKKLLSGGVVAMLADQSAPQESIYVNFFGRPAATFQGPAVFALKSNATIVFALAIRNKDYNYEIVLEELDYSDIRQYNEANIYELTKRHVELLEKYIRLYPGQWLWSHKRWKHSDKYEIYGKRNT